MVTPCIKSRDLYVAYSAKQTFSRKIQILIITSLFVNTSIQWSLNVVWRDWSSNLERLYTKPHDYTKANSFSVPFDGTVARVFVPWCVGVWTVGVFGCACRCQ